MLNRSIQEALKTLNISWKNLRNVILEKNQIDIGINMNFDFNNASAYEVFLILKTIGMDSLSFYEPYHQDRHLTEVCSMIEENSFYFKKSKAVKRKLKKVRKIRWKNETQYLGFKLRWNIRLKRLFDKIKHTLPFKE
ncbi:MAG: hypothetical protein CL678_18840 [Bdellovibrionaceae bacterium]|nr:hypothetical protein [Pseudobdellovibrionaceae bacterium]